MTLFARSSAINVYRLYRPGLLPRCCAQSPQQLRSFSKLKNVDLPDMKDTNHSFYNYTSGGWTFNEQMRLKERHLVFDVSALLEIASKSVQKSSASILNLVKKAEGNTHRDFEVTFNDNLAVIARLPYPCTIPHEYVTASEVATMQYLRLNEIPVPKVLDWSTTSLNAVGSEYIIMAKVGGSELRQTWDTATFEERRNIMKNIVAVETKLLQLEFPASGSIYHRHFLQKQGSAGIPIPGLEDIFCVGPSSGVLWWHGGREQLDINRGPWYNPTDVMMSVGNRELSWLERFGKPRYPRHAMYRELYGDNRVDPAVQIQVLRDYLKIVPFIAPFEHSLRKSTLRHPQLSPDNIFVSRSGEITALDGWHYTTTLPLFLAALVPEDFRNWGDEDSDVFRYPKLPDNFETLPSDEQEAELATYQRRQAHYFYCKFTNYQNVALFNAIIKPYLVDKARLYHVANRPWEGNPTSLKAEIIRNAPHWIKQLSSDGYDTDLLPVYSDEESSECLEMDKKQDEKDKQMLAILDYLGVNMDGWSDLHQIDEARATDSRLKSELEKEAESEKELAEMRRHWPLFKDFGDID